MTFGQKIKEQRRKLGITQDELATRMNLTIRAISSYENDKARPRGMTAYKKLAQALEVNLNFLLTEEDEFIESVSDVYGDQGVFEAKKLVEQIGGMYAGGRLSDDDLDAVMRAMQDVYWKAKEETKLKQR